MEKIKPACPSCKGGTLHSAKKFVEFGVSMKLEENHILKCPQCLREFKEEKRKLILLPPEEILLPLCPHCDRKLPPPKIKIIMGIDILEYCCKNCEIQLSEEEVLQ